MTFPQKKTVYLIGVGTSLAVLAGAVTLNHNARVAEDAQFAQDANTNGAENINAIEQPSNVNTDAAGLNTNNSVAITNVNTNTSTAVNINVAPSVNTNTASTQTNTNTTTNTNTATRTNVNTNTTVASTNTNSSNGATGTFSTAVTYLTPEGDSDSCTVSVTLANDVVTASSVSCVASSGDSRRYQSAFTSAYKTQVVGKNISAVKLSRVGGATLTTNAFNKAITQIQGQL